MTEESLAKTIRDYVIESTLSEEGEIDDDTLLFEEGIFDSMGLLLLIEFLKDNLGVETNDEELTIENFSSINSIVAFVNSKKNVVSAP